jgi:hypothetical protein
MNLHINAVGKSLNKYGEELCGDKVEIARVHDSTIAVLADGLGSGVKANILATLTSKIITTMLVGGASVEQAVDTIVNTLPVCAERQIAYCTFSILQVWDDGQGYLVEFDNPFCVFIRNGQILQLPCEHKVYSGKEVYETHFAVIPGDILTLMSDGIIYAGETVRKLAAYIQSMAIPFANSGYRHGKVPDAGRAIARENLSARHYNKKREM